MKPFNGGLLVNACLRQRNATVSHHCMLAYAVFRGASQCDLLVTGTILEGLHTTVCSHMTFRVAAFCELPITGTALYRFLATAP